MNISFIREQLQNFQIESEDLYWQNWVGLKDEINIVSLFEKYSRVFSIESLSRIQEELRNAEDSEIRHQLRALLGLITLGRMENDSSQLQQEILKLEATTTIEWGNEIIPLRALAKSILNETDRNKRIQMIKRKDHAILDNIVPYQKKWMSQLFESIRNLGYENYLSLCSETQNRDFYLFSADIRKFLDKSENIYREYLDYYLKKLSGIGLSDSPHNADLSAVLRCSVFDSSFPPENLLPVLKQTIQGMGFGLERIHLDMEDRPKKKTRPCVSAVNPPIDVRLTVSSMGGYDDYAGLLHETGHAVHFIHEKENLEFEFKYWGDRGFTEGTAYLFQMITMNEVWLKEIIRMQDSTEFIKFNAFLNILRFRRLIGQALYQFELFSSQTVRNMDSIYQHYMERSHCVEFETSGYLNFDMEFYSAGYLRARMFETQLRVYLMNRFGPDWWRKKETGQFLTQLYLDGRKSRADDVVISLGFKKLDPQFYLDQQLDILSH